MKNDILMSKIKKFLVFSAISGVGWLLDFSTFSMLVLFGGIQSHIANFISSYVGVTFVWFVSLGKVFHSTDKSVSSKIIIYWVFQFLSILFYSKIIHEISVLLTQVQYVSYYGKSLEIIAKIIATPLNLITNFIFMQQLVKLFKSKSK
ncbi:hypothetical protein DAQ1742_00479 [Dickeya aquatica]|uniref:GtrA/DPMS transmembrane domain-containing protein n=2 Tax=Pectobacteriaceae TaxID=1903410 RepID=A0A375A6D0_9GAMM|nr:hypothetical protein DAQ1742_00479 [Dickeya aquatica]